MCMKNETHSHQHGGCQKSAATHCGNGCCGQVSVPGLTEQGVDFLRLMAQTPFLPLGCFVLKSSHSNHLESVAFAPVYLTEKQDDMDAVKEKAKVLEQLEEYGIITLDYDIPLENYDYEDFKKSAAFNYFKDTVEEGKQKPDFIFDIASIEFGSIALTPLGRAAMSILI